MTICTMTIGDLIQAVAAISAAVAAFFAWQAIATSKALKKDDELLAHAAVTLERAYEALASGRGEAEMPVASRLAWLTSARLIENYLDTKSQMSGPEVRRRCEGHEEYWRNRFYGLLTPLSRRFGYYDRHGEQSEIEPRSAVIVHSFADWPEGKIDPIDRYPNVGDVLIKHKVSLNWAAVRQYLGRL